MTDAPVQAEYRAMLNALAEAIDEILNGKEQPKRIAFALFIAEFGAIEGGRVNYISNSHREDMKAMAREWLARAEGAYGAPGGRA